MSEPTIDVARYVAAFRTWAQVFASSHDRSEDEGDDVRPTPEIAAVETMLRRLDGLHGEHDVEQLCERCSPALAQEPEVELSIRKSNLLARMIYGGEELRERPCPVHDGRWSGYGYCPAGCAIHPDPNITGWLPNGLVDDWPERPADAKLAALEVAIRERFDRDELLIYADYLQQLGDPRGYLIPIDPVLAFPEVEMTNADAVRTLFDRADGRFVRRVTIECAAWSLGGIVRFLATRDLPWLVEIVANHEIAPEDLAKLRARAPMVIAVLVMA